MLINIKKPTGIEIFVDGKDTIVSHTEITFDTPMINAIIRLTNRNDTTMTIYPKNSKVLISYKYNNELYSNKINLVVQKSDSVQIMPDSLCIQNGQYIELYTGGLVVEMDSSLSHKIHNMEDFTLFLLEILPTLKFHFEDNKANIIINDYEIQKVKIEGV